MGTAWIKARFAQWALICAWACIFSASGGEPKAPPANETITVIWPLTYSTGRVKAIGGQMSLTNSQGSSPTTPDTVDRIVEALNAIAAADEKAASATAAAANPTNTVARTDSKAPGTKDATVTAASKEENTGSKKEEQADKQSDTVKVVQRVRNNLLITGKHATVLKIKRLLTLLDAPWPQVQLDVFAFQVSGCPNQITERTQALRDHINKAKRALRKAEKAVCETVRIWNDQKQPYKSNDTFRTLDNKCYFNPNPHRELTLTEALTFLCLSDIDIMSVLKMNLARNLGTVDEKFIEHEWKELNEGTQDDVECYRNTVAQFATAWREFKSDESELKVTNACEKLQQSGAVTDKLLQKVMDHYTTMVRTNLAAMILPSLRGAEGVSLAGQCRIVVTSSLESGLIPTVSSWAETTRVKPLSGEEISTIMTAVIKSLATNGLDPAVLGPVLKLLEQPEPVYTRVAPGIELHVRPTVLPSAAEARLQIYARFGVETGPADKPKTTSGWNMPPAATVESHEMATDTHIGIFDLFDISSFEITTSHPQSPFYVPVLGRIPWLGVAFQIPRRNKEVKHVSIILVNAVIIPRATDLLVDYP